MVATGWIDRRFAAMWQLRAIRSAHLGQEGRGAPDEMGNYDFKALDDKEFEAFCADLIGEMEGTRFERFKPGRDGGVDARCLKADHAESIMQCKHRPGTSFARLLRHLQEDEKPKVDRLKPVRYILCLSTPLSKNDKSKIAEAMAPHIRIESDIFGAEDLNVELEKRPAVAQRHYKLWLCSANVLSLILDKPIFDRSASTLDDAREMAKRYVVTSSLDAALSILETQQVLIVSGEPGAGKTSLAEHIALRHVAENYEFFKIAENILEAERVFATGKCQLFYFDDFLGTNYLQALSGHEGNQIANFIRRVRKDKSKRFILTSRTTILNQGKILMDNFEHQNLKRTEYELNVSEYKDIERARILYSHLWHSALSTAYIDKIYEGKRYRAVIDHRNFNPRLIAFITDSERVADRPASEYWPYVVETLNNPANIWDHAFTVQLDHFGRLLVLLVALNGRSISETELAEAYSRVLAAAPNQAASGRREFRVCLRHLTGSFLTRNLTQDKRPRAFITLFNPSIADYVYRQFAGDTTVLRDAFVSLRSISSLHVLSDLAKNKLVEPSVTASVLRSVLLGAHADEFMGYPPAYIAFALDKYLNSIPSTQHNSEIVAEALDFVLEQETPSYFAPLARLIEWGLDKERVTAKRAIRFVNDAMERGADDDDLRLLGKVWAATPEGTVGRHGAEKLIKERVLESVRGNLDEWIDESDVFAVDNPWDEESVRERVEELTSDLIEDYGVTFDSREVNVIADEYDIPGHRESHFEEDRSYRPRSPSTPLSRQEIITDDVDELFDRG